MTARQVVTYGLVATALAIILIARLPGKHEEGRQAAGAQGFDRAVNSDQARPAPPSIRSSVEDAEPRSVPSEVVDIATASGSEAKLDIDQKATSVDPAAEEYNLSLEQIEQTLSGFRSGKLSVKHTASIMVMAMMDQAGDFQASPVGQSLPWSPAPPGYSRASRNIPHLGGGRTYLISEAGFPEYALVMEWINRPVGIDDFGQGSPPQPILDATEVLVHNAAAALKKKQ